MSKILIVDDDEMMLMMARHILSRKYEIVTATTGAEAIEIFEQERPDMVLSDLMMPEMDGYELHQILQERSAEPVPIMFMTADESGESESKGFELGAADYIRKLEVAASTDPLTGLLNKAASQREIGESVRTATGSLMMIDLDSFKLVNDIHGHAAGDKILTAFAELIRKIIRENDLAGRMGGDEFVAFLKNVDDEKILRQKTNFLNDQLFITAKKILGSDTQIPLGTSVGAVFVPDGGTEFQTLYKKADAALYDVKQHGKHGLAIFGTHNHRGNSSGGLSQLRMILDERNPKSGAFFVDFETFKKIYRLLSRMADNYKKGVTLMQFSLNNADFAEVFKEILLHALRKSDCVTQSENKFLVLLMEATEQECDTVRTRIFSRLNQSMAKQISFERENIF